jgi:hypothetical protein
MSESVLVPGDKVHIVSRRLFPEDLRRHFVGVVVAESGGLHKVEGYGFVFDEGTGRFRRKPDLRRRVFSLGEAQLIVNQLPSEVDVDSLQYVLLDGILVVTNNRGFRLDINEFGPSR